MIYDGNDGGFYVSPNGGENWIKKYDLHITQFYAIEIDYQLPQRLYGGTQDNGTLRTLTGALDDWEMIYGGDGFYTIVNPTDSDVIFAEYQWGGLGKSVDGGYSFGDGLEGIDGDDRRNWSTPVVMDPNDPDVMYYGTYRIYKSIDQAEYWNAVSPDLTSGVPAGYTYHTVTTIAVAPTDSRVIYAGTDDGNIWISTDTGGNWDLISLTLPERWVTRVAVSNQAAGTAYATYSGNRWNEYTPHIFRTEDYGQNWDDISGNMPEVPVNAIVEDPEFPSRLFIGTDVGVFYTENLGQDWDILGTELPLCGIHDLKLHNPSRTLVAGTHGRSMYKTCLDSILLGATERTADLPPEGFKLYPAYPNPFNNFTAIEYEIPHYSQVSLVLFNSLGRETSVIFAGYRSAGIYWAQIDGSQLSSGIYFINLATEEYTKSQKIVYLK